jgi:transposase
MENEFLKKYLALVQRDDKKKQQQRKDREQSKLSEN